MSVDDDPDVQTPAEPAVEKEAPKPARKRAAKKKAAKKRTRESGAAATDAGKASEVDEPAGRPDTETGGGEESGGAHANDRNPQAQTTSGEAGYTESDGKKTEGSGSGRQHSESGKQGGKSGGDSGGRKQQRQQHEGSNRNDKSSWNKKNRRKKGRWQNRKKKSREEDSAIQLGGLPDDETLEDWDRIQRMADELTDPAREPLDFLRIYNMELPELRGEVESRQLATTTNAPNREELVNALVADAASSRTPVMTVGVLDLLEDESGGLLVYERDSYRVKGLSAFVPQAFIDAYGLQCGHIVKAQLHPHRESESCPFVVRVESVMGRDPTTLASIVPFTERVPYYPLERILLETDAESKWDNLSMRVVDCLTPIGLGQRGLIVAPPRTGKTLLLQGMANAIQTNYPAAHLIVLLVDERPEEVTDFRRQVTGGEVISSTFDEAPESHVHAAEMVIEKSRRMVENGEDVVILLDSVTRLARAYNTTMPNSGKILSGGVEANALQKPKRFFGSARNIEDGGSLTIIATALVETGSKMDEVIFEEFKGTGNMELHLDRGLSDKRIYPALSMDKSGTRKEELLYHPDEMQKIYSLRRAMKGLPSTEAMEMLIQRIKKTRTNAEFLMSVAR
ncbi:MAG: transcription termination factor Rho [Opitutales bacterium]